MALIDKLKAIGDAIRAKTGGTEGLTLDQMVTEIEGISGGGSEEQPNLLDALIEKSITEVTSNIEGMIDSYVFYNCSSLTMVDFPLVTSLGHSAFYNCSSLTTINFPLVTNIGNYAFYNCSSLTMVDFPLVTNIGSTAFSKCSSLTTVDFPLVTTIEKATFKDCTKLKALVLRTTSKVCTLSNSNAFSGCTKITTTKDGYIYVPAALIESYKVATNWVTYASQFRALEDYTVDGTTTGALDESKI